MIRVVAICGMPGSGKGIVSEVAQDLGIPVRSMGDMIRAEVENRGIEGDPQVFGRVAQELRDASGDGVLAELISPVVQAELESNDLVLIEGMRGVAEQVVFVDRWGSEFGVLAIHATDADRLSRIQARGRAEDGDPESFQIRDERERGWGLRSIIDGADWAVFNDDSLEVFRSRIRHRLDQWIQ